MVRQISVLCSQFLAIFFLLVSCNGQKTSTPASEIQNETSIADGLPISSKRLYQVNKFYDSTSKTHYFLTRIFHKDIDGKLVKLKHARSIENLGETTSGFAKRVGCTLAFNASMAFNTESPEGDTLRKPVGIQVIDGKVIQERATRVFTLGIMDDNRLVAYPSGTTAQEILDAGSNNALTAFVPLIENHEPVSDEVLDMVANLKVKNPRQVIAQLDNLDIIFLSCGGRGYGGEGMTANDVIRVLKQRDVKFAFNLDGGGSVSTVVEGDLITWKIDKNGTEERKRPNFLYVMN